MSEGSPLYPLLNEINKAAKGEMPFLAIAMTVALPDICAALASPGGQTTPKKYKNWCRDNLPEDQFGYLTPDDLYSMRCGVLHQGRFGGLRYSVKRVVFVPPSSIRFRNSQFGDAYYYSIIDFCMNFTTAVFKWMEANRENENIKANLPHLMQYREEELPGYTCGFPVLA